MKPIILYPVGGGGRWLSNLIYSLNSGDFNIVPSSLNFHSNTWKKTNLLTFQHWPNNVPPDANASSAEPHQYDVFAGPKSRFITFINGYVKKLLQSEDFIKLLPMEQFFFLSNGAKFHLDKMFNELYLDHISLDTDLLFVDPTKFAGQLFELLDRHKITYINNLDFIIKSIDNFKSTCRVSEHYGNIQSPVWQAWCHALILGSPNSVDASVPDSFNNFLKFIENKNTAFKTHTQKHFLTKV
jgi:hypothetical protein